MKTTKLRTRAVTKAFKATTSHLSPGGRDFAAAGLKFHRKLSAMKYSPYMQKIHNKRQRNKLIKLGAISRRLKQNG